VSTTVVTGHRPHKLPPRGTSERRALLNVIVDYLRNTGTGRLISGAALGIDTDCALAALALGIDLHLYLPLDAEAQRRGWAPVDRHVHAVLIQRAKQVIVCADGCQAIVGKYKDGIIDPFQNRDEHMVDQITGPGDRLFAVWDGSDGGTANTVRYAVKTDKLVDRLDISVMRPPVQGELFERKQLEVVRLHTPKDPKPLDAIAVLDFVLARQRRGGRPTDQTVADHFGVTLEAAVLMREELERAGEFG